MLVSQIGQLEIIYCGKVKKTKNYMYAAHIGTTGVNTGVNTGVQTKKTQDKKKEKKRGVRYFFLSYVL